VKAAPDGYTLLVVERGPLASRLSFRASVSAALRRRLRTCGRCNPGAGGYPGGRDIAGRVLHSITSSARASTVVGISRPSALAALRLMTSSYFVGA
jgi:hypothetical protein